jgi:hypothetical protein
MLRRGGRVGRGRGWAGGMRGWRLLRRCVRGGLLGCVAGCGLLWMTACKTTDDAVAASAQMSSTATSLAAYYAALQTLLVNTDQLNTLNKEIYGRPYPAENQELVKTTESEVAKRVALAKDVSTLAASFAKLTGSTASADVSASAVKLETECDTLASVKASAGEQSAMKAAMVVLVSAVQAHEERKAAMALDSFAKELSTLFVKEEPSWVSVNAAYTVAAGTTAGTLVDEGATDNTGVLKVALDPFGLTPTATAQMRGKLAALTHQQITTKMAAMDASYGSATDAMAKALDEMSTRIHTVAVDKPMAFRMAPPTLAAVDQWTTTVVAH